MRNTRYDLFAHRHSQYRHDFKGAHKHQSGAVLPISLVMLLLLTVIGVTGSQMTGLEEKMAGNMRDRNIAFQAAESALRDAEQDIKGAGAAPPKREPEISGITDFFVNCNADNIENTADDGLCDRGWGTTAYRQPSYSGTSVSWAAFTSKIGVAHPAISLDMTTAPSVQYGTFTGAAPIPGLSAQPRYIIEGQRGPPQPGQTGPVFYYRITARAQGVNPNTVVWLQEIFTPL